MPSPEDVTTARERRTAVVAFIYAYTSDNGYGPTRAEIAAATGVSMPTTYSDLASLRDQGRVTWTRGKPRTLHLT